MIETITLASVAAATLHEGIKFLYGQAGEALRGWRQRKRAAAEAGEAARADTAAEAGEAARTDTAAEAGEAVRAGTAGDVAMDSTAGQPGVQGAAVEALPGGAPPTGVFDTRPDTRLTFDPAIVEQLADELTDLRHALMDYADDVQMADSTDSGLLATVDGLRRAIEAASGVSLTFKGEERAAQGPQVSASARIEQVRGYVAVLRAENVISGSVTGRFEGREVAEGGEVTVVDVGNIGGSDGPARQ